MSERLTAPSATVRETLECELAAEVLRSFGRLRLRVTGASMLPVVRPGDTLVVQGHNSAGALPGEVVLFHRHGRVVAHRVISRILVNSTVQWVTRGDSVAGNDAPVSRDELLGRVTGVERGTERFIPCQSRASRLISWVLQRSDFCTRLVLHFEKPRIRAGDLGTNDGFCSDSLHPGY